LQFSVANLFNIAFGALMTLGAFFAYATNVAGPDIWVSAAIAALGIALVTVILGKLIYRPFVQRARRFGQGVEAAVILVSFGVSVIIQYSVGAIWGDASTVNYRLGFSPAVVSVNGFYLTWVGIASVGVAAVLCVALAVLLRLTQLGRAMRATAGNESLARACGIPVERILDACWLVSGAFCGLAGVLLVLDIGSLTTGTGSNELLIIMAAAIVGGIGSPLGAVVGALIVSIGSEIAAAYLSPNLKYVYAFALLCLVLLFRPAGVLGSAARRKGVAR